MFQSIENVIDNIHIAQELQALSLQMWPNGRAL